MVRLLRLMKTKPLIFIETKTEVALSIPPYYTLCYMFYLQLNIFINDLTAILAIPQMPGHHSSMELTYARSNRV